MIYAKIENNIVVQVGLPKTGIVNGQTVSNFDCLPESTLLSLGWLPYIYNIPDYDEETQYIQLSDYTITETQVTGNYIVLDNPIPEPSLEDRLGALETVLIDILI